VLHLLPPSYTELGRFPTPPTDLLDVLWSGAYPAIHDRGVPADRWLADYVTTYLQRDVRQVLRVGDLERFTTLVRLCAGRTANVLNLSALAGDCGIATNTARSWVSVLETGYIVHRLSPWHRSLKKQLIKAPKLHLLDSGLACYLLGIREPEQLRHHPLRGAVFESWVVAEALKGLAHHARPLDAWYFRDHKGLEVDLVLDRGDAVVLVEVKAGATVGADAFRSLERVEGLLSRAGETRPVEKVLVYGGDERQRRTLAQVIPWHEASAALAPRSP
jgi:predicted AAA+ superfamily ATPase